MRTSLRKTGALLGVLLLATTAYAVENTSWGQIKSSLDGQPAIAAKATTTTTNEVLIIPDDIPFDPVDCNGTMIHLSGRLHIVTHTTDDGKGGVHFMVHFQPMGVRGVDDQGRIYQGTGIGKLSQNVNSGESVNDVSSFKLIGRGDAPTFFEQIVMKLTVNANGEPTAEFVKFVQECRD